MDISQLRREYHQQISAEIIRIRQPGNYPNFADGSSEASKKFAWGIVDRLNCELTTGDVSSQASGRQFEIITRHFVESVFSRLHYVRPGHWEYSATQTAISQFVQYEHLEYIESAIRNDRELGIAFGGDYIVRPDIVVSKRPATDEEINQQGILGSEDTEYAAYTHLRQSNYPKARPILHAVISCKWSIRTDRAQNTRTEVLNLIRNRKGHVPHIVAVTAEPWPARIAALALGTGDLDCVYHFALHELLEVVRESSNEDSIALIEMMVNGRRLRDISDLPFDLAV